MTTKKKIVFVVNPISGTQGKRAILKWIDERINRTLYDYTIVKTQYAGHAEKIAATAAIQLLLFYPLERHAVLAG